MEQSLHSVPERRTAAYFQRKVRPFYDYLLKKEIVIENDVLRLVTNLGMKKSMCRACSA